MAYFSNGEEGLDYQEEFCFRCQHWPKEETKGCPVWGVHVFYAYELCNEKGPGKAILDMLIPMELYKATDGGEIPMAGQCTMFLKSQKSPQ